MRSGEWKQTWKDNFSDGYQPGDLLSSIFNHNRKKAESDEVSALNQQIDLLNQNYGNLSEMFEKDKAETYAREDSVYQRGVEDMRKAGLNPYTIGASPSPSSASSVGANNIQTTMSMVGYIMDLKNIDAKNKATANSLLGNILSFISRLFK